MIRIAITVEAFEAIAATLPLGSVGYEAEANERGERLIWIEDAMTDRLGAMRGPGESYKRRHPAAGRDRGGEDMRAIARLCLVVVVALATMLAYARWL
jgi:hypothetical protein